MTILIIFVFLFQDLIDGFSLLYKSLNVCDKKGGFAGGIVLFITILAFVSSVLYNKAIGTSDTEYFQNAAILLFLNEVDDKMYSLLKQMFPEWVSQLDSYISKYEKKVDGGVVVNTTEA